MPSKRKPTSAKKEAAAQAENKRLKTPVLVDAAESSGHSAADEIASEVHVGGDGASTSSAKVKQIEGSVQTNNPSEEEEGGGACRFLGKSVSDEEARRRWPHRYKEDEQEATQARHHFLQAEVDGQEYFLEEYAYVNAEAGKSSYICKIIELFEAIDGSLNFTAQWFFRSDDTVIKTYGDLIDSKEIFFSEIKDDNPLDCLVKKLRIVRLPAEYGVKEKLKASCDYYFDKMYLVPNTSFVSLLSDSTSDSESDSVISSDTDNQTVGYSEIEEHGGERTMLDLYSGCGAMSTGLCLGANSCGVKLVTKWAVDINEYACESLRLNHPETQVRNESAQDFLQLLMEWEKLCESFLSSENHGSSTTHGKLNGRADEVDDNSEDDDAGEDQSEVYEVEEILAICYGDPNQTGTPRLLFKIRWKGYGPEEDTWEALECLSGCQEKLKGFVAKGYKAKMLPLPGSVDVICGGPPCQGISGFNRFRNKEKPLEDPKNKQLIVFMDIVAYLRPRFVLMENVVDIVKFADGFLGRYALGRLVAMGYQARMGMMAAGAFGLPQFRLRMFMWGALPTKRLPQYPLPTHNVIGRGVMPTEFESNTVAYEEGREVHLKGAVFLGDAISDLPNVENNEERDETSYVLEPQTDFQRFIRLRKDEMPGHCQTANSEVLEHKLYDHRPLCLKQDDYERVCQIPKKKGANFRDLPGVRVRADNKVEWDPAVERKKVTSGKPLVPDYAMSFVRGTSSKPFRRLWWDETVRTVVTRAEPHNQAILHPVQDRVLTIRENARLQGFPDYYRLLGPIKERYIQVGNAVAVPVARALGYSLALALRGLSGTEPVFSLPEDYPMVRDLPSPTIMM